jgi:hypothetical protein
VEQQRLAGGWETRDGRYRPRLIKSLKLLADWLRQQGHAEEAAAVAAECEKLEASQPDKPD